MATITPLHGTAGQPAGAPDENPRSEDFPRQEAEAPAPPPAAAPRKPRDPRLDFYRGIAMFIILSAHIPGNRWASWIPARFGMSDAAEIFVFCSGMASAIAFGGAFSRHGWPMGTARVAFRCWQVFWAHAGLFFFTAMCMAALDYYGGYAPFYVKSLNLEPFFDDTAQQIVGLFTLTYVPNFFDILPMYLVVLALMPLMMALSRIGFWAAALASVLLWLAANPYMLGLGPEGVDLPAEPWSDRPWFFNPFGWQLLFFTGFAFMRGWLPAPPVSVPLVVAAAAFVLLSAPFGAWKVFLWVEAWNVELAEAIRPTWSWTAQWREKTDFGLLRYMHFLSLAYLGWAAAGEGGKRLIARGSGFAARIWAWVLRQITKVGQQSLAVFVFSMALARLLGFLLDRTDRGILTTAAVNIAGFGLLIACAYTAAWFKSQPWRARS